MVTAELLIPVALATGLWWGLTGLVLWACSLTAWPLRIAMLVCTVGCYVGLTGAAESAHEPSVTGSYLGFVSVLLVWCWLEMTFLLGLVTGPNREACPPHLSGTARFKLAFGTIAYHELALLLAGAAILIPSFGAQNHTAAITFLVMWVMRLSAKLNLFFGVRNFYEGFLPSPTRHLASYFRRSRLTVTLFVSIWLSAGLAAIAWMEATAMDTLAYERVGAFLVATLLSLSLLEHLLLVLPIAPERLWLFKARLQRPVANA
ncbi:MAG: DUF3623 family protein [Betaproteobacteria bacterium]|nr:DUF3623 family protein [Betaproteobacteria bacterium]